MVGGFVGGLLTGNLKNAFIGAAMGAAMGYIGGVVGDKFGKYGMAAMSAVGLGMSIASEGVDGVAYFAGGILGGMAGAAFVNSMKARMNAMKEGNVGAMPTSGAGRRRSSGVSKSWKDPSRPDADGELTFFEAYDWWKNGNKEPLTVDVNKLNLSKVTHADFNSDGVAGINLASNHYAGLDQGLVYGGITLEKTGVNTFRVKPDTYNFEMHSWSSKTALRNVQTFGARILHGSGQPFKINFDGHYTIQGR